MSCRNPHKRGRAYLKHQAPGYLSRGWQRAVQPFLSDPLPVRFAFLLGARTHLPALLSTSPPPQPNSEPTLSSSLQVFAKAHLFFPWSSVLGLLLHSCSPLIRCSTPSKSAPEEGGEWGERSQPWAQLSFPPCPCPNRVHGPSPSFRAASLSASFYTSLGYLGSCAAENWLLLSGHFWHPAASSVRQVVTWKARFLQEMVQTEAAKQGFCTKSSEEDFRWRREMGRCLLASKGLLLGSWEGFGAAAQPGWAVSALAGRVGKAGPRAVKKSRVRHTVL